MDRVLQAGEPVEITRYGETLGFIRPYVVEQGSTSHLLLEAGDAIPVSEFVSGLPESLSDLQDGDLLIVTRYGRPVVEITKHLEMEPLAL
jgi:antitoxin (DNA-binding transcriptional repressor) of toxin-antitoxin stability system